MRNMLYMLIAVLLLSCKSKNGKEIDLPFYNEETFTAEWIEENDSRYDKIHTISDFEFVNQEGEIITNKTFDGKVYVANFFFTMCPTVCPKMEANLSMVQDEFKDNSQVKILSHTVMPWADSVARLKEYAQQNEINSQQWHLVTGEQEEIYKMGRLAYFADEGFGKGVTDLDDFLHTENIVLIDQKRRIRGIYNGTLKLEMRRMMEDIRYLIE
ncbi:protein SCO1/2 [Ekhidna lutea]|uniref:Protein SCO1/2 n=1 Tax=Ekhidna lutea TaxID=447679 RepID=A0A239J1I0_EKHLU|nr:SCO family protein [Ekhidna lutea]SNS99625.1 protein SCO1/2 [Ekhidna lutea]